MNKEQLLARRAVAADVVDAPRRFGPWQSEGLGRRASNPWSRRLGLGLGLIVLLVGCTVPAPTVRQGLDYGFRTPEQTFRSWRTAVQGDLLVEEYKTLSKGWRAKNGGASLFAYSEARDTVLEKYPQLRWLLYRAKEPEVVARGERMVLLQSRVPGPLWFSDHWLVVRVVRQGYWDLWVDSDPYQPTYGKQVDDIVDSQNLYYSEKSGTPLLYGIVEVKPKAASWPDDVSLLEVGWEWKIDDFQIVDAPLDAGDMPPGM
ncbi:MAG: hypothetical protein R3F49_01130 [Planctomycetota bacterium]